MTSIRKIHHVAVAVADVEAALPFWRDALGLPLQGIETVAAQASRVAMLPAGEGEIELVQPTSADTGVAKFLEKRGPGLHHLCLEVDDLDGMVAALKARNIRLIGEKPTAGAGGRRMIFVHPESTGGVLVELYEGG